MKRAYYKIKDYFIKLQLKTYSKHCDLEIYDKDFKKIYIGKIKANFILSFSKKNIKKILEEVLAYLNISEKEITNVKAITDEKIITKLNLDDLKVTIE